jgi:murein DD-endopeptidase
VVAAAPGLVTRIANDFDRGGLKVCIDHGAGLFTTSNHLAQATVKVGERVTRGQIIGRSGASGMEFVLFFPWVSPHLHFNTWLNGVAVDPFAAAEGEESLWRSRNAPVPHEGPSEDHFEPSAWSASGVARAITACRDPVERARMEAIDDLSSRAAEVLVMRNYHPSMFETFPDLYERTSPRRAVLDLPFRAEHAAGVLLPDRSS